MMDDERDADCKHKAPFRCGEGYWTGAVNPA